MSVQPVDPVELSIFQSAVHLYCRGDGRGAAAARDFCPTSRSGAITRARCLTGEGA